jgi:hypothetical protein
MKTPENGYESQRKAAAINYLLGQIGLSNGRETEWWNHQSYPELGDRTPTQAWLAGDEEGVRKLVDKWYAETRAAVDHHRSDPEFMAKIREKIDKMRAGFSRAS